MTDAVCNLPALGVSTALVIGFTAGNDTGATYSVASIGFDVINDDQVPARTGCGHLATRGQQP